MESAAAGTVHFEDRRPFSEDEKDLVRRLYNLVGSRWSLIAGRLPNRTAAEIEEHWTLHRHQFTPSHIDVSTGQSTRYSPTCSMSVNRDQYHAFPSQFVDQANTQSRGVFCEESVDSTLGFSEDEEALIERLHGVIGNRWSIISRLVPGRNAEEIEEHWNRMETRRKAAEDHADCGSSLAHHSVVATSYI